MNNRIFHFIKKEIRQLKRDNRMLFITIAAPVIQLLAMGYIASTDIKHVSCAVLDRSNTKESRAYIQSFKNSGYFDLDYYVKNDKEVIPLLDSGRAKAALCIPPDFGRKLIRGEPVSVQAVLDGENSSSATIILGYLNQINFTNSNQQLQKELHKMGLQSKDIDLLDLKARIWYNPELKSKNFMVPAIFALLLTIQSMILTAFAIVKEKERGTMEQLVVTPIKPYELIMGKLLPFAFVAFINMAMVFLVAVFWFKVPIHGSVILLFSLGAVFLASGLGAGVFISTISQTQSQALLSAIFILIPSIIISGFIFPIANMPKFIQGITYLIPVRYFLVIVRGIFLKGIGMQYLWGEVWPLIIFGIVILSLSVLRFRKKID